MEKNKVFIKTVEEWTELVAAGKTQIYTVPNTKSDWQGEVSIKALVCVIKYIKQGHYYYYKAETVPLSKEEIYDLHIKGACFLPESKSCAWRIASMGVEVSEGFYWNQNTRHWESYEDFLDVFKFYCLPDGETKPLTKVVE